MKFSLGKHLNVDLQYIFGSKWNVNAEDLQIMKQLFPMRQSVYNG